MGTIKPARKMEPEVFSFLVQDAGSTSVVQPVFSGGGSVRRYQNTYRPATTIGTTPCLWSPGRLVQRNDPFIQSTA
jgi:hypothetical protein